MDSVWLGMKLGVAMIGMIMMGFFCRGLWRGKRAGDPKEVKPLCAVRGDATSLEK